jgi:ATP-dependent helicase HrpA
MPAREAWAKLPKQRWEREGLQSWAFEALPDHALVEIAGARMHAYPALCDREGSVSLSALASRAAADAATRAGLRRLFLLQAGTSLAKLEQQVPAKAAMSALVEIAPRSMLAQRAVDEAFALGDPAAFPRTKAAFTERLMAGQRRLGALLADFGKAAVEIGGELDRARAMLRGLDGKPGAPRSALADVRAQLAELVTAEVMRRAPRERLAHLPRYLRAIQVRLERLPNGPQKDQAKAAQVAPFFSDWQKHREGLRARGVPEEDLDAFRWLVEEFRVSIFAPELRAAVPVSQQRLSEQWKALTG